MSTNPHIVSRVSCIEPRALWLYGLPGAGKTTLAALLRDHLRAEGASAFLLDGDNFRQGVSSDLRFSDTDRAENIRRAAEVAALLLSQGSIPICAFVTPRQEHRAIVNSILGDNVHLIHVRATVATCQSRDPKGLYAQSAAGKLANLTGIDAAFDEPEDGLYVDAERYSPETCRDHILLRLGLFSNPSHAETGAWTASRSAGPSLQAS